MSSPSEAWSDSSCAGFGGLFRSDRGRSLSELESICGWEGPWAGGRPPFFSLLALVVMLTRVEAVGERGVVRLRGVTPPAALEELSAIPNCAEDRRSRSCEQYYPRDKAASAEHLIGPGREGNRCFCSHSLGQGSHSFQIIRKASQWLAGVEPTWPRIHVHIYIDADA